MTVYFALFLPNRWYCPAGSTSPQEKPCPPGRFGGVLGLATAECAVDPAVDCIEDMCKPSECSAGYFCPGNSTSATQFECGHTGVFCPAGSGAPTLVSAGHYTTPVDGWSAEGVQVGSGFTRTGQEMCPRGHYCNCEPDGCKPDGIKRQCPAGRYGSVPGLATDECSGLCAEGHYCEIGSTSARERPCPGGTFGATEGLTTASCSGLCVAGHFCPIGSVNNATHTCGGAAWYCPEGSAEPIAVNPGYYTVGGHEIREADAAGGLKYVSIASPDTRVNQAKCEAGHYCSGDGVKRPCPAGRYGQPVVGLAGLSSAECSGLCHRGFWCPEGSTQPMARCLFIGVHSCVCDTADMCWKPPIERAPCEHSVGRPGPTLTPQTPPCRLHRARHTSAPHDSSSAAASRSPFYSRWTGTPPFFSYFLFRRSRALAGATARSRGWPTRLAQGHAKQDIFAFREQ